MAKSFVKVFLICLVLFTLILIPVIKFVSNIQIFDNSDISGGIEDEIDVLVDPNSPFFDAFADAKRVNLLALGINDGLSDVLMLVSWDMDENKVDLISVPRDTYYEREGYNSPGQKKINAAYASKEGLISTANAVSDVLMGIPINYYAIIDYDAVEAIVDGVGGVTVDVPKAMKYDDPYDDPPLHISIPAGVQTLDGEHAVQYLRFRKGYSNGDIGRIRSTAGIHGGSFQAVYRPRRRGFCETHHIKRKIGCDAGGGFQICAESDRPGERRYYDIYTAGRRKVYRRNVLLYSG